jgi:hypothetical protein
MTAPRIDNGSELTENLKRRQHTSALVMPGSLLRLPIALRELLPDGSFMEHRQIPPR